MALDTSNVPVVESLIVVCVCTNVPTCICRYMSLSLEIGIGDGLLPQRNRVTDGIIVPAQLSYCGSLLGNSVGENTCLGHRL